MNALVLGLRYERALDCVWLFTADVDQIAPAITGAYR